MGLLSDAAALARGRFVAVVLTAALPLVPAFLVAGGVVFVAAARVEQQLGTATRGEAARHPPAGARTRRSTADVRISDLRGGRGVCRARGVRGIVPCPRRALA